MLSSRMPNTKAAVGLNGKLRYFSLVEQASLQEYPSQRNRTPIDVYDENVRNTWLCVACFHGRGDHNHYQVPIRVGGGYSICHFNQLQWFPSPGAETTWKTIRWLLNAALPQGDKEKKMEEQVEYGDDYTSLLYQQFIQHGGNKTALQDYLESNFDQDVLDELAESGVDVTLIKEYTDRFRSYIKSLLANNNNKKKQEQRVQRWAKQLTMVVLCEKLDETVMNFDKLKDVEAEKENVASLMTQVVRHVFVDETSEVARKLSQDVKSLTAEAKNFNKVHEKIKKWVKKLNGIENESVFETAKIFKEYMEEGGRIHHLQEYISNIENREMYLKQFGEEYKELVKKYAELVVQAKAHLETVMEFPDSPQLLRAYLDCGGDYKLMLDAISVYLGSAEFTVVVEEKLQVILSKLFPENIAFASKPKKKRQRIINHVLVPLIEKTKVEFLQDRFCRLERRLNTEGGLLLQILKQNLVENGRSSWRADVSSRSLTAIIYKQINDRKKLWMTPKPFEIHRDRVQLTVPQIPFTHDRFYNIESLTEDHILDIEKKQRHHLEFLRRGLQIPQFQQSWKVRVRSPLGSLVSEASFQNDEGLSVLINGRPPAKENTKTDKQLRRDRQRLKMVRAKKKKMDTSLLGRSPRYLSIPSTPFTLHDSRPNMTPVSSPVPELDDEAGVQSITINLSPSPQGIGYRDKLQSASVRTLTDSVLHSHTPEPLSSISSKRSSAINSPDSGIKLDSRSDSMTSAQPVVSAEEIDSIRPETGRRKSKKIRRHYHRLKTETKNSNKLKSKSWSGIPPSFMDEVFGVDNGPPTAVERLKEDDYSINNVRVKEGERWEEFEDLQTMTSPREDASTLLTKAKVRMERMQEKRRSVLHKHGSPITWKEEDSEEEDFVPLVEEDEDDILKHYTIIRNQRVANYRKIFERYAILKEVKDKKETIPTLKSEETLEYELAKVDLILLRINTSIEELQEKVIDAKGRIHSATACIARIKYNDLIFTEDHVEEMHRQQRRRHDELLMTESGREASKTTSTAITDTETLKLLTADMRRKCEKYGEVRGHKLALLRLRSQLKEQRVKRVAMTDRRHNLARHIEQRKVARGISCLPSTTIGSYAELTNSSNNTIQQMRNGFGQDAVEEQMLTVDIKNALLDVNPKFSSSLRDWEGLQQAAPPGISGAAPLNFRFFTVICALYEIGEDERDFGALSRSRSLDGRIKWCQLYYKRLLGPDRRVLHSDLLASGMTPRQCSWIVEKLASREYGRGQLDFMEFVAHLPLFIEGHQHIVRSPLRL